MAEQISNNVPVQQSSNVTNQVNFFDPAQFATAQRMSQLFASSMLVPDTYQVNKLYLNNLKGGMQKKEALEQANMAAVANCMIAIDIATRIGASPLMVMQNLAIIYGRPSWSSKFLIATVNTCGRFEPLKFRFTEKGNLGKFNYTEYVYDPSIHGKRAVTKEFDGTTIMNLECVAYTVAKGSTDTLESSPVSIRMAVDEGWYTKNGSKWRTMPKQMLMYRTASFWTSAYAPEISMGMHTVEEIQDAEAIEIHDDAQTELQQQKDAAANKEEINLDEQPESPAGTDKKPETKAPEGVDPATGEIKNPAPKQPAPAKPAAPQGPQY
jgi:hypothetical protein